MPALEEQDVVTHFIEVDPVATRLQGGDILNPPELVHLALAASGLGGRQAARHEWVSEATVRSHRANTLRKLGAVNMPHAIGIGFSLGLLKLPESAPED